MDIKELNKKQLILVTLLITFVVSIATGIVTVSLMQKIPKSVPQTINNVIQRTIEKITTIQVPTPAKDTSEKKENNQNESLFVGVGNVLISIYGNKKVDSAVSNTDNKDNTDGTSNTGDVSTGNSISIDNTSDSAINKTNTDTTSVDTITDTITTNDTTVDTTIDTTSPDTTTDTTKPESIGQGIIISDVGLVLVDSKILKGYEKFKVTLNKIDFDLSILKKFSNGFAVLKIQTKSEFDTSKNSENTKKIDN